MALALLHTYIDAMAGNLIISRILSSTIIYVYYTPIYIDFFTFPLETIENGRLVGSINGIIVGGAGLVMGKKGLAIQTNRMDGYADFGDESDTCLGYFILCSNSWVTAVSMQPRNDSYGAIMPFKLLSEVLLFERFDWK